MSTLTPFIKLIRQALGENPGTWGTVVNTNLDMLDFYIGKTCVRSPTFSAVPGDFVGQRVFQPNAVAWWVCTVAGDPGTWVRELPRGIQCPYSGVIAAIPAGWTLCDGNSVVVDGETVQVPDLSGRFVIGHSPLNPDYDARPDAITADKYGGAANVLLGRSNLPTDLIQTSQYAVQLTLATKGCQAGGQPNLVPPGTGQSTPVTYTQDGAWHTHTFRMNEAVQASFDIIPPYFAEAIILKL